MTRPVYLFTHITKTGGMSIYELAKLNLHGIHLDWEWLVQS